MRSNKEQQITPRHRHMIVDLRMYYITNYICCRNLFISDVVQLLPSFFTHRTKNQKLIKINSISVWNENAKSIMGINEA